MVVLSVGVTNLRALLAREKDEDTPRLNILLCEAFVAAYMSLIVYAVATCDCHILYRLAGQSFNEATWATLFGGGVKKLLRVAQTNSIQVRGRNDKNNVKLVSFERYSQMKLVENNFLLCFEQVQNVFVKFSTFCRIQNKFLIIMKNKKLLVFHAV